MHPAARSTARPLIFVSYSRHDKVAALALRDALETAGLLVFRDEESVRVGDQWMSVLQKALGECSAFVVLVGRDGVRRWVGAEVQVALTRNFGPDDESARLPIFPVLLDGAPPESLPPFLALFQAANWNDAAPLPVGLIEALRGHAHSEPPAKAFEGCPFLGLRTFQKEHARLFFGRRQDTLEALAALGSQLPANPENVEISSTGKFYRWLEIRGDSGAGKSSLVNAGMLPMIERGALWARTGIDQWRVLGTMMPGKNPLVELAELLRHGLKPEERPRNLLAWVNELEGDKRALALALREHKEQNSAFLLVIDQFEELFTVTEVEARRRFDVLLACALEDSGCPLYVISTVRADFLHRYEELPRLQAIYRQRCNSFPLSSISEAGLREVIEGPADLAGLDVSRVAPLIRRDARNEVGALPLVENALAVLWGELRPGDKCLSDEIYESQGGIAGMLEKQADDLLERIDEQESKGRQAALNLLLWLTRVNDDGRHTRQRISREEAVRVAGEGDDDRGERIVQMLAGPRAQDGRDPQFDAPLRLIITTEEQGTKYVDLIHETLIRPRDRDAETGKQAGYWPTLYEYIEKNRESAIVRQLKKVQNDIELRHLLDRLTAQRKRWEQGGRFGRWWRRAGLRDMFRYRQLNLPPRGPEARFLAWSRRAFAITFGLWALAGAIVAENFLWLRTNHLPTAYLAVRARWMLGFLPTPELVPIPSGRFTMGCGAGDGKCQSDENPPHPVTLGTAFEMGKYEVTFLEYDTYVWHMLRLGKTDITYPDDEGWGRFDRPVINVSRDDVQGYLKWLLGKTGQRYRLPSETEWEYAARAGSTTRYPWGDEPDKNLANFDGSGSQWSNQQTAPVGSFPANAFGLYDMIGNVWEWVEDCYHDSYQDAPANGDPWDAAECVRRVVRGGSWSDSPGVARSASRGRVGPGVRFSFVGFRLARTL